jgi:hypothetical protein
MTMGQGLKLQRCEIESEYYNNDELRNNKNQWSMGRIYYGSDESEREERRAYGSVLSGLAGEGCVL